MSCDVLGSRNLDDLVMLSSVGIEEVLCEWLHPPIWNSGLAFSIEVIK